MTIGSVLFIPSILFVIYCFGQFFFKPMKIDDVDKTISLVNGFVVLG